MQILCKTESQLALFFVTPLSSELFPMQKPMAPEVHGAGVRQSLKKWESGDVGVVGRGEQKFDVWKFQDHERKIHVS